MGAQGSKGSQAPKITSHDRAILDLKLQRDKIKQYQKRLLAIESLEKSTAKQLLARGEKQRALSALRRGKYQQSLLTKTDEQVNTLQELVSNIEFSQIQQSVYHGLEQGNAVLKEIHKTLNAGNVEKLLEQTDEAVAYQREIDEMLATKMTADEEAQVQEEMALLEAEQLGQQEDKTKVPVPELPDVPQTEPVESVEEQVPQRQQPEQKQEERQAMLA
ncbi:unnamed protein product [Sympodiomycopsis kandeliae]